MANIEFGFGGGYQPTEFIKRYLPDGYFDLLVVDEGHEYKNSGSAQGRHGRSRSQGTENRAADRNAHGRLR